MTPTVKMQYLSKTSAVIFNHTKDWKLTANIEQTSLKSHSWDRNQIRGEGQASPVSNSSMQIYPAEQIVL